MLDVGDDVAAKDRVGSWLAGRIVGERNKGGDREFEVHFLNWNDKYNEWFAHDSEKLRCPEFLNVEALPYDWGHTQGQIDGDDWRVDSILKKRMRNGETEVLVHWDTPADLAGGEDSWIPIENVHDESLLEGVTPRGVRRPRVKVPYTSTYTQAHRGEVPAGPFLNYYLDDLGRKAAAMLAKQREEFACRRFMTMSPCPPTLFTAMHERLVEMAKTLEGMRDPPLLTYVLELTYLRTYPAPPRPTSRHLR